MANYAKIRRDAVARRGVLQDEMERAKRTAAECEKEIAVLDQIIGALKGVDGRSRGGKVGRPAKGGRKKGGKWRKGHPGRPPKWYVEQQKGKGAGKKKRGRRKGARRGRRPAAAPAPAPTANPSGPA